MGIETSPKEINPFHADEAIATLQKTKNRGYNNTFGQRHILSGHSCSGGEEML